MSDRMLLISADGHITAPPETFRPYLEQRFHPLLAELEAENAAFRRLTEPTRFSSEVLELIDGERAIRSGGETGSWDVTRRLVEMDREGVAAEMLIYGTAEAITPFFGVQNRPHPPEVRAAGARAYHRFVADSIAASDGRLFAVADPGPCLDMDATLAELRWVAARGFRLVAVPGIVPDPALPHLTDSYYEPFWAACADLGLGLSVHSGHGVPQGRFFEVRSRMVAENAGGNLQHTLVKAEKGTPFFAMNLNPAQALWSLMLAGVFDAHPSVQLVLTETRSDWVPATLALLDRRFDAGDTPLRRRPSEYWQTNCWVGVSSIKRSEIRLRHEIGPDRMMFGRDYPHPEGTWPNTWDWLRDALVGFDEREVRALLGENALRCYGLDGPRLRAIAARIGPRPADIMRDAPSVDPRLVDHFDYRSGYRSKSYEVIDEPTVGALFDEDLALTPGGGPGRVSGVAR